MKKLSIAYGTYDECYEQGYGVMACCIVSLNCFGCLCSLLFTIALTACFTLPVVRLLRGYWLSLCVFV